MSSDAERLIKAILARIDDGRQFQLKDLTRLGVEGSTSAQRYILSTKLLRINRKRGAITFKNGWWQRNRAIALAEASHV